MSHDRWRVKRQLIVYLSCTCQAVRSFIAQDPSVPWTEDPGNCLKLTCIDEFDPVSVQQFQSTLTLSSTSTSTCTYIDIDNISTYIDIEINVWSIPKFTCMFVCVFVCGFICDIATGHTNEATIMKFGMKGRCVKF